MCVCVFSLFCEAQSEILSLFFIQAIILPNVKQQKSTIQVAIWSFCRIKAIVHPKYIIFFLFIHPHVIPFFLCRNKEDILKNESNQTVLVTSGFYYAEGKKTIKKVMQG